MREYLRLLPPHWRKLNLFHHQHLKQLKLSLMKFKNSWLWILRTHPNTIHRPPNKLQIQRECRQTLIQCMPRLSLIISISTRLILPLSTLISQNPLGNTSPKKRPKSFLPTLVRENLESLSLNLTASRLKIHKSLIKAQRAPFFQILHYISSNFRTLRSSFSFQKSMMISTTSRSCLSSSPADQPGKRCKPWVHIECLPNQTKGLLSHQIIRG